MKIHDDFTGGNIKFIKQCGDDVYLDHNLRDTKQYWFYWAFCVEGAAGKKITFHMHPVSVGYWGAAMSYDLENWHWVDNRNEDSFTYEFSEKENKVYFAHSMFYHPKRFLKVSEEIHLNTFELCKSRKGRSVPACTIGSGEKSVILTARHHACESTGSYVLEGVLREFSENPIEEATVFCVPFVDYDGVVDGDQGKGRTPHDHNRDYMKEGSIYPETAAIREYVEKHGCNYGFDFHSPWHRYDENDTAFIVRNSVEKLSKVERFSKILEKQITPNSLKYSSKNDFPPMTDWNRPCENFSCTMNSRPECEIAHTLECTYFGTADNKVSEAKLIELGRCYARTIKEYMKGEKNENNLL